MWRVSSKSALSASKHTLHHPLGLITTTIAIPEGVWSDLSMDFIEGLSKFEGYIVFLMVVDRLTKFAHFITLKHPYTAAQIAKVFMDNISSCMAYHIQL